MPDITPIKSKPRWGPDGRRDPIAHAIAVRLRKSPFYIERSMREAALFVARVVAELRKAGADARAERYVEPILRANEGREPPPDCDATWTLADLADGKEDVAESAYHRNPTIKTRAAYIEALREDRRHTSALIDMLVDEQERAQHDAQRQS
jgi:hypothetical protein